MLARDSAKLSNRKAEVDGFCSTSSLAKVIPHFEKAVQRAVTNTTMPLFSFSTYLTPFRNRFLLLPCCHSREGLRDGEPKTVQTCPNSQNVSTEVMLSNLEDVCRACILNANNMYLRCGAVKESRLKFRVIYSGYLGLQPHMGRNQVCRGNFMI